MSPWRWCISQVCSKCSHSSQGFTEEVLEEVVVTIKVKWECEREGFIEGTPRSIQLWLEPLWFLSFGILVLSRLTWNRGFITKKIENHLCIATIPSCKLRNWSLQRLRTMRKLHSYYIISRSKIWIWIQVFESQGFSLFRCSVLDA